MKLKFKNGNSIKSITNTPNILFGRQNGKTLMQTKWILEQTYKSLKWHQKLRLWFKYRLKK